MMIKVLIGTLTLAAAIASGAGRPRDLAASYPAKPAAVFEDEKAKAEVEEIKTALSTIMHFSETAHFTWCTSLAPNLAGKIQDAAEKAYGLWADQVGEDNWRSLWMGGQKCMIVICANKKDYREYISWYANKYPVWDKEQFKQGCEAVSWFPLTGTRNVGVTHFKPHDESFVTSIVVHLVGHLVAERTAFNNNFTPAWLTESTGIWMESQIRGAVSCGCYQDPYGLTSADKDREKGLPTAKLKLRIKENTKKHRLKNTKGVIPLAALSQLSFDDVQATYARVDWMMSQPKKYAAFLRAMKKSWPTEIVMEHNAAKFKAQEKAFQEVFEMNLDQVDQAVDAHVATKY